MFYQLDKHWVTVCVGQLWSTENSQAFTENSHVWRPRVDVMNVYDDWPKWDLSSAHVRAKAITNGIMGADRKFNRNDESRPSKHEALAQCWADVGPSFYDAGPTSAQNWANVSCLLGCEIWRGLPANTTPYPTVFQCRAIFCDFSPTLIQRWSDDFTWITRAFIPRSFSPDRPTDKWTSFSIIALRLWIIRRFPQMFFCWVIKL